MMALRNFRATAPFFPSSLNVLLPVFASGLRFRSSLPVFVFGLHSRSPHAPLSLLPPVSAQSLAAAGLEGRQGVAGQAKAGPQGVAGVAGPAGASSGVQAPVTIKQAPIVLQQPKQEVIVHSAPPTATVTSAPDVPKAPCKKKVPKRKCDGSSGDCTTYELRDPMEPRIPNTDEAIANMAAALVEVSGSNGALRGKANPAAISWADVPDCK
jgi:hypothetical protein